MRYNTILHNCFYTFIKYHSLKCFDGSTTNQFTTLSICFPHSGIIVSHACFFLWIFQILVIHVIFLKICWRPSKLAELFRRWDDLRYPCPVAGCTCPSFGDDFRWRRNVISGLAIFHTFCQWMASDFPVIVSSPQYIDLQGSLMEGFPPNDAGIIFLNFIGGMYSSVVYVVPTYFFALIAVVITLDFHHLRHDMQVGIQDDGCVTLKSLEWFRIRHNSLCILLNIADDIFSGWIALTLGAGVCQALAGIFLLVAGRGLTVITDLTQAFWVATYFFQISVVLYRGAVVNEAVIMIVSNNFFDFKFYIFLCFDFVFAQRLNVNSGRRFN